MIARHLEAVGIPTVVVGSARDIVEHCGVPRFLFTDFPLGNPCGKPDDREMQLDIVSRGVDLLERAYVPRTTVQTPYVWEDDESWRRTYMELTPEKLERLRIAGDERRARRAEEKAAGLLFS